MTSRERLTQGKYDSLDAMVAAYAAEAVEVARRDFHERLHEDRASLDRLEAILNRLSPAPDPLPATDADWLTLLWGSWFGEWLRTRHGGAWSMSIYPGSDFSVPTLEVGPPGAGSRLYPMMKVHRRLSLGIGESLPAFYSLVAARLANVEDLGPEHS